MDERTMGLVLRTRVLTETSLIVHWLTRDFGRISTVAKGARRPKSPFAGKLDLFYLADLSFHPSRRGDLHSLREVRVRDYHKVLRVDLGYLQQASYFAQLLEQTTETDTPVPDLFDFLVQVLSRLPECPPNAATVLTFEIQLLAQLGLKPDLAQVSLSPTAKRFLEQSSSSAFAWQPSLSLSAAQNDEASGFLERFLTYHLGKVPSGRIQALGFGN